jgi:sporulation protein YlmC with PRC-barrel domain
MIFKYGSDVITVNGEKVGEVKEVVIDPRTEDVTHVIIEKGF